MEDNNQNTENTSPSSRQTMPKSSNQQDQQSLAPAGKLSVTQRLTKSFKKFLFHPFLVGMAVAFGMSLGLRAFFKDSPELIAFHSFLLYLSNLYPPPPKKHKKATRCSMLWLTVYLLCGKNETNGSLSQLLIHILSFT